mmetsp:Transcript_61511/g.190500  ORF Transcript_61511/g.190500 Transcript_61511/m.190500 type:complete len:264 (-) Transcript_61511:729-1520(-)
MGRLNSNDVPRPAQHLRRDRGPGRAVVEERGAPAPPRGHLQSLVLARRPAQTLGLQPAAGPCAELDQRRLALRPAAAWKTPGKVLHVHQLPLPRLLQGALALGLLGGVGLPQPEPQAPLLEAVVLLSDPLAQPLGDLHAGTGVGYVLVRRRDADELLEDRAEAVLVVVPVNDGAHVKVREARVLQPLPEPCLLHLVVCAEDLDGDRALSAAGIVRLAGNEHVTADALILEEGVHTQEVSQSLRCRYLNRLVAGTRLDRLAHGL